jgi:uncharacterized membrane protein YgcG
VFLVVAVICFIILILRRYFIGGELGGPKVTRYASCFILICLWVLYIVLSIVEAVSDSSAAKSSSAAASSSASSSGGSSGSGGSGSSGSG